MELQSYSNSPHRLNLVKINPLANNNLQQANNFTGINIRRQQPINTIKQIKKEKQLGGIPGPVPATPIANSAEIVEQLGCRTRTGFIPQMRKVNQDSYCIQRELGSLPGLWMFGVMDGHGVNGH